MTSGWVSIGSLLGARGAATGLNPDLLAGAAGLERRITLPHIQKTGLALAGFDEYLRPGRVLIFGESEIRFLERLAPAPRQAALRRMFARDFPCVMITMGLDSAAGTGRPKPSARACRCCARRSRRRPPSRG